MNWTRFARPAAARPRLAGAVLLAVVVARLPSCTGDGSTLDPFGAPLGPPQVVLTPARIDLSLIEGTDHAVEIGIANGGGLPLRVDDVTSSSPFITPQFDGPRELRSGESVTVGAQVSALSALASPQDGVIEVATNDPESPRASVSVHVLVTAGPRPEIDVQPDSVTVRVAPDGSDAKVLVIRNLGTAELHVTDVTGPAFVTPGLTAATVAVGDSVGVVITVSAVGYSAGSYVESIVITSDDEDEGQLQVPILLSVESPFPATLAAIQANVFTPRCSAVSGCHGGAFPMVGLNLTGADSSYASMAGVRSVEVPSLFLVEPGNANDSYLVVKIEPNDPRRQNAVMPAVGSALDADVIDVIRRWIDEGAQRN
jgi:hypothetical protein